MPAPKRHTDLIVGFGLMVSVFAVFGDAVDGAFLDWDDELNFTANQDYRGFGWSQIRWAFTTLRLTPLAMPLPFVLGPLGRIYNSESFWPKAAIRPLLEPSIRRSRSPPEIRKSGRSAGRSILSPREAEQLGLRHK